MEVKLTFYPEFSKELKPYAAASLLYGFIIKESEKNYKAVKNLSCEGSFDWFLKKFRFFDEVLITQGFNELLRKGFIRRDTYLNISKEITRYTPLRLPRTLRDKYDDRYQIRLKNFSDTPSSWQFDTIDTYKEVA